jgi:hypothetical protein
MTPQEEENWRACASALFGAHRMNRVPEPALAQLLRRLQHHRAIEALRNYRDEKPFKGFYIDKFAAHLSEADAADEDGTDGAESAAARLAAEREYNAQLRERVEAEKADEWTQFRELPERALVAARERGAALGIGTLDRDRGFRLLAIDMYYGLNRENWEGPNARWQTAQKTARKPLQDDVEAWRMRAIHEIERLRVKLRDLQLKHGEVVDVT